MVLVVVVASIYMIWKNRNLAYWEDTVHTVEYTVNVIKITFKQRILRIMSKKIKDNEKCWLTDL